MPLQMATAALILLTGVLFGYVGLRLRRRRVEGDAALAWSLFVQWWLGLSALTLLGGGQRILSRAGFHDPAVHLTISYVSFLLLVYALWALLYYLVYLFTGDRRILFPISVFYIAYYILILYLAASGGYHYDASTGEMAYAEQPPPALLVAAVLLLVVPQLMGAMAYFRLFFKTREPTQRYRIGLVAGSILAWFGTTILGYIPAGDVTLSGLPAWPVVTRLVGLVAALVILAAYLPPRWLRERYGLASVDAPRS